MNRHRSSVLGLLAVFFATSLPALAGALQAPALPPPPPPKPQQKACMTEEFRQFDFWLGNWNVTDPRGHAAGTNSVTLEHGGCVLEEHWAGAKGGTGSSFNIYDANSKKWHQTWVDNTGTVLQLDGGMVEGRMVLEGKGVGTNGEPVENRIAWEKLLDGRVRQTWTVSGDNGASWSIAFDGFYTKK